MLLAAELKLCLGITELTLCIFALGLGVGHSNTGGQESRVISSFDITREN